MIKKLWKKFVINRYISAGLSWGDAESYRPMLGKCLGYESLVKRLNYWEAKYKKLGYRPIPMAAWILAGGYGEPLDKFLKVKDDRTEA